MAQYDRTLTSNIDLSDGDIQKLQSLNYFADSSLSVNDVISISIIAINIISRVLNSSASITDGELQKSQNTNYVAENIVSVADLVTITTTAGILYARTLNDAITTSDLVIALINGPTLISRTLNDYIDTHELSIDERDLEFIVHDITVAIFDSIAVTIDLNNVQSRILNSNIALFDSDVRYVQALRLLSDQALEVSDLTLNAAQYIRVTTDLLSVSDSLASIYNSTINVVLSSSLGVTDTKTIESQIFRAVVSTVALLYNIIINRETLVLMHDNIDIIVDVLIKNGQVDLARVLRDTLGIEDAMADEIATAIIRAIVFRMVELNIDLDIEGGRI